MHCPPYLLLLINNYHIRFSEFCYIYLTQVQDLGLAGEYLNNEDFRHFVGMMDGLAFLPLDMVGQGMNYLQTVQPEILGLDALVDYFNFTYVTGKPNFKHTIN